MTPAPDGHRPERSGADAHQVDEGFVDELAMERSTEQVRRRTVWRITAGLIGPGALCAGALMISGAHPGSHAVTLLSQRIPDPASATASAANGSSTPTTAGAATAPPAPCPLGQHPLRPTKTPGPGHIRREIKAQQRRARLGPHAALRPVCVVTPASRRTDPKRLSGKAARTHKAAKAARTPKATLTPAQRKAAAKRARQAANRAARKAAPAAAATTTTTPPS